MAYWEDLLLYAALGLGYLASRWTPPPKPLAWTSPATVLALVGALGLLLRSAGPVDPVGVLLPSVGMAAALVATSALYARALGAVPTPKSAGPRAGGLAGRLSSLRFPVLVLAALFVGYLLATLAPPTSGLGSPLIEVFLLLLLFQVGWEIRIRRKDLRRLPVPLAAAGLSAATVAVAAVALGVPWRTSAALVGAFGWYTLAGPLVTSTQGATFGLIAFLANFLRENFTMVGAPALGAVSGAEGITAAGGATTMDTTLYFVTTYGRKDAGAIALGSGTVLTLLAPVLLLLLLGVG